MSKGSLIIKEDIVYDGNVVVEGNVTVKKDLKIYGNLTAFDYTVIPVENFKRPNTFLNRLVFLFLGE